MFVPFILQHIVLSFFAFICSGISILPLDTPHNVTPPFSDCYPHRGFIGFTPPCLHLKKLNHKHSKETIYRHLKSRFYHGLSPCFTCCLPCFTRSFRFKTTRLLWRRWSWKWRHGTCIAWWVKHCWEIPELNEGSNHI